MQARIVSLHHKLNDEPIVCPWPVRMLLCVVNIFVVKKLIFFFPGRASKSKENTTHPIKNIYHKK
jgi:hypothetical protein